MLSAATSRRPVFLLFLALSFLGISAGMAFGLLQKDNTPSAHTSAQTQVTPTPLPNCVQLPQQIDWQHLSAQDLARYGLPHPPTSLADLAYWVALVQYLKHRSCTISVLAFPKLHPAAQERRAQQSQACPAEMACQNPTWAGGIASQRPYRTVESLWSLPCVNTDVSGTSSSAWVGLGGVTSTATLVQAGIDNDINEQGQVLYEAWAEAYTPASTTTAFHDSQVNLVFAQGLHCGDLLYVQVNSDVEGKVDRDYPDTYFVGNLTTGEYQYYNPAAWRASDGSSAEWIVERPTFMSGQSLSLKPLTNFGTLNFTFCLAYVEQRGFLADHILPLRLVNMEGISSPLATATTTTLGTITVQWKQRT